MSATDFAEMSTDELIQDFIHKTEFVGGGWPSPWNIPEQTPEREAVRQEIYALSEELRTRKPIAQVRQLFDHESRDVRGWASGQFLSIDPEWADATSSGLAAHLSTREVLALCARAQLGPPAHPALEDMSNDQLIERFEDAAVREYATSFLGDGDSPWDVDLRNRIVGEIHRIGTELKSRNALAGLLPLLDHSNSTVRTSAAIMCRTIAPEQAVQVLEAVAAKRSQDIFGAAWGTLYRLRSGSLK